MTGVDDGQPDERDKLIDSRSDRLSGMIMSAGIYAMISAFVIRDTLGLLDDLSIFLIVNFMIVIILLAEIAKLVVQLILYRRVYG